MLHLLVLLGGLTAVYWAMGRSPAALATVTLLGLSQFLAEVLTRIWHNALLPGVALLFLALLHRASTARDRAQSRALLLAWALLGLMLQLHVLSVAYAVPLGLLQLAVWRRTRFRGHGLTGLLAWAAVLGLLAWWGVALSGLDWNQVAALRAARGEARPVAEALGRLPRLLASAWSGPATWGLGWVVLAAAAVGLVIGLGALRQRPVPLAGIVAVQVLAGLPVTLVLTGVDVVPRYYTACVPGIIVLAGTALGRLPRAAGGAAVALAVALGLAGGWLQWPTERGEPVHTDASFTLSEQSALLTALDAGWSISATDLERRVHSPAFGGLGALRYLAWAGGLGERPASSALGADEELTVVPAGFPEPALPTERRRIEGGSGRALFLIRHPRRVAPEDVRIRLGRSPCPLRIPFHWSHLERDELAPFGLSPGFQVERCRAGAARSAPLDIEVSRVSGHGPLVLVLAWFDVSGRRPSQAALIATDARGDPVDITRLTGELGRNHAVFTIQPPPGGAGLRLQVAPVDTLALLDLY